MKRGLALALVLLACTAANGSCAPDFSLAARQADFHTFVAGFADDYAYLDRTEKPWLTWESRYAGAVAAAATPEAYAAVFEAALDELHDFHAEVRSHNPHRWLPVPTFADVWAHFEDGKAIVVAVRRGSDAARAGVVPGDRIVAVDDVPIDVAVAARLTPAVDRNDPKAQQWALLSVLAGRADEARRIELTGTAGPRTVELPVIRTFDRADGPLSATILPGNIGLIRLNNSLGEQATVNAFDAALEQLRATRALAIDLRDVPSGGDSSVALGIMGRFTTRMLPYQRRQIVNYGQSDVQRNWFELVAPRGPFTYAKPVVVIVDHWTGSMGEGMAIGFDGMHRATVVGTPMAHLAGAVDDFTLPKTGVDVAYATERLYHIDGTPRQDWLPPILLERESATGSDHILAVALEQLPP